MKASAVIVLLGIALMVLLAGCVQSVQPPAAGTAVQYVCADGKTTVANIASCPATASTGRVLTEEEKALEVCSGMPTMQQGYSLEDFCIIGVAGKYKNSALCSEASRDQRLACYAIVAELKLDPGACLEAGSMADQCYRQYASDKKDATVCDRITDISGRDSCYDNLVNQLADPALCEKISSVNTKDNCYSNIAMRLGDPTYCDKIANASMKQSCQQNTGRVGYSMPEYK